MQPPSSRTGAWRTHHHRVAIVSGLSGLDIAKALQYCSLSLYVRARIVSSDLAFEILFEFRKAADADAHNTTGRDSWAASKANPSSSQVLEAASDAQRRCCSPGKARSLSSSTAARA